MSSPFPSESATFGNLHVGDVQDDDGPVIDSFLVEVDEAPTGPELISAGVLSDERGPLTKPKRTTRIITGTAIMDASWQPNKILVADPNRQQLLIRANATQLTVTPATTLSDYAVLAFEPAFVTATNGFRFRSTGINLDDHTGDVWVAVPPGVSAPIEITWLAVTGETDSE